VSKSLVTRLFIGAALAMIAGLLITFAAVITALANGVLTIGGPQVVSVNGAGFAGMVAWLLVAALAFGVGSVLGIASWIGALVNTYQLEDKTWFVIVLVLGIVSLGWVAMLAYVVAGPDGASYASGPRRFAVTPGG
jgi:hypothetical protein